MTPDPSGASFPTALSPLAEGRSQPVNHASEPAPPFDAVASTPTWPSDDLHEPWPVGDGRWRYGCPSYHLTWTFPSEEACRWVARIHVESMHDESHPRPPFMADSAQSAADAELLPEPLNRPNSSKDAPGPYPSSAIPSDGA